MLTDFELQEIISCSKRIIRADRKKLMLENRHYKNNLSVQSTDEKYLFRVFMRVSEAFMEDFSIGLIWTNPQEYIQTNKSIIMLRCQGPHDGRQELGFDIHHDFHTHEITVGDIQAKRFIKPSNRTCTTAFGSYNQALVYFIEKCGILNPEDYFDIDLNQMSLL